MATKQTRPTPAPIPFTQPAFDQLKLEKERLATLRKEVLVRLQAAREMGDLSENGAYTYAKLELGSITRQQRQNHYLLTYGRVTESTTSSIIGFGSQVTLKTPTGKTIVYTLVSIHESDLAARKISTESPLGAALLGRGVGDVISVEAPAGTVSYEVVEVT